MTTRRTPPAFVPSAAKPVPANGPTKKTLILMGVGLFILVVAGLFTLNRQSGNDVPVSTVPEIVIEGSD